MCNLPLYTIWAQRKISGASPDLVVMGGDSCY